MSHQPTISDQVFLRLILMLSSIQLNDQTRFQADEIDDVRSDGVLSVEAEAVELFLSDSVPQETLGIRYVPAQLSGTFDLLPHFVYFS